MAKSESRFNWSDPFQLDQQLSHEERLVRDTARAYCQDKLVPRVLESFRHEKTDVAIFRPSNGAWFITKSSTNYTTYDTLTWGASGDVPVPGDFDGDGKTDIALYRPSTGLWLILLSSTHYGAVGYTWGVSTDLPVPGDYDGDGKIDLAVYRPSTGQWFVLKSSSNYTAYSTYLWGTSSDKPVSLRM